jgi:hypothetical protein
MLLPVAAAVGLVPNAIAASRIAGVASAAADAANGIAAVHVLADGTALAFDAGIAFSAALISASVASAGNS